MKEDERRKNYVPDWLLERYRLGELDPTQKEKIEKALWTDPLLVQRLEELTESDQEILEKYPVPETVRLIREKQTNATQLHQTIKPKSHSWHLPWAPLGMTAFSAAAVLCLFLVFGPRLFTTGEQVLTGLATGTNRVKGLQNGLHVYMQRGNQAVLLENGFKARAQDVLQLGFIAAENYYAVILSLDGNGIVTLHLPEDYRQERSDTASYIKAQGKETLLPYSYKLDSAPDFERFFLITSHHGFSVSSMLKAAQKLFSFGEQAAMQQALPLTADFTQYSLLLIKEREK